MNEKVSPLIGFIGQGWIGRNFADNFEERGYKTVRYAKEEPYCENLAELRMADIVFVAVPTPTTPQGFDAGTVFQVLSLLESGQTVVIKSTILPGTTDELALKFPALYVFHSPEFLREATVKEDIAHPDRNIIGIPTQHMKDEEWKAKANLVMSVLPQSPYDVVCTATEAEITKYGGNNFLYLKIVFMNVLYDLATHHGARWDVIANNMSADPRIGKSHMQPVHQHKHMDDAGAVSDRIVDGELRGAGGHCFIKDFAALREHVERVLPNDKETLAFLRACESKNNQLLIDSGKDAELFKDVYGEN
jgi:UDP-glucose 6-dehydrogenase